MDSILHSQVNTTSNWGAEQLEISFYSSNF